MNAIFPTLAKLEMEYKYFVTVLYPVTYIILIQVSICVSISVYQTILIKCEEEERMDSDNSDMTSNQSLDGVGLEFIFFKQLT